MKSIERLLAYSESNRGRLVSVSLTLVAAIAVADWLIQPNVSLGVLYVFPIVLAATCLARRELIVLACVCSVLREAFAPFRGQPDMLTRMAVGFLVFSGAGLLVSELVRNRRLIIEHLRLRDETEQELRVLDETSPLANLTVNASGEILLANASAHRLLGFERDSLQGERIGRYLPILTQPLAAQEEGYHLRTAVECRGRNTAGQDFLAQIWFSTYQTAGGLRLAAVVWDATESLRDREDAGLESLMSVSRIMVGAVSHEVRNLAAAALSAYRGLGAAPSMARHGDFQALGAALHAMERVAASGLRFRRDSVAAADLGAVLDEVRIVVEPSFRESGITADWAVPEGIPLVQADHQGLLQVVLNLLRNSERAMQYTETKNLSVRVVAGQDFIRVRVIDSGCGVNEPERLFSPFQEGAEESGLGLYVSRAILRSYDGDLRVEAQPAGACFIMELRKAPAVETEE